MSRLATLVAVVVLTAGTTACGDGSSPDAAPTCIRVPSSVGTGAAGSVAAPTDGGVQVVEQGFGQVRTEPRLAVSIGARVRNTSSVVAYGTTAEFRLYDAKGVDLTNPADERWRFVRIPVLMPGEEASLGTDLSLDAVRWFHLDTTPVVARVGITLSVDQWWKADNAAHPFAAVRTSDVVVRPTPPIHFSGRPALYSSPQITFTTSSPYCDRLAARGAGLVYRDRAGRIIGGAVQPGIADSVTGPFCPAGVYRDWKVTAQTGGNWLTDIPKADVTVYCDFAHSDGTPMFTVPPYPPSTPIPPPTKPIN